MRLPKLLKTCAACKVLFEVPAKRRSRKYCSVRCSVDDPLKKKERSDKVLAKLGRSHDDLVKTCPCGKTFTCSYRAVSRRYCTTTCRPISPAMRKAWSDSAHKREFGGKTSSKRIDFRKGDGTVVHLQSTFEEHLARSLEGNGVKWCRPASFPWKDGSGKWHRYYPDFFLPDLGLYLDPKNDFLAKKDALKIKEVQAQNGIRILVLDANSLSWEAVLTLANLGE